MSNSNSSEKKVDVIPKVLLQAKKEAAIKTSTGDPWDKGHWANRS